MASTPRSTVTVSQDAAAAASGSKRCVIMAPVVSNADMIPRLYTNYKSVLDRHGYAQGVDLAALHNDETGEQFMFIGLPIDTAGAVGQLDSSGNTGTSNVSIAVGADGALDECDVEVVVKKGGVVGTSLILLDVSLDGGRSFKTVRLGTATSYTIPHVGLVISATVGTLNEGDVVLTAKSTAPTASSASIQTARENLAAQQTQFGSAIVAFDSPNLAFAQAVTAQMNAYETANQRYAFARVSVEDRHAGAMTKQDTIVVTDATFAEVGASGDTITLGGGTWAALGAHSADMVKISGASDAGNNKSAYVAPASITGAVITMGTTDLVNETGSDVVFTFSGKITFDETADTVTRSKGSFIGDGFKVGQTVTFDGTASNDGDFVITTLSATVMGLESGDVAAAEVVAMADVTVTVAEAIEDWSERVDAAYAALDGEPRISLSRGRGYKLSPILQASLRRPAGWAAHLTQYQHDVHIPTWQVALGTQSGWSLTDTDNQLVEYDDRVHGGTASQNKFTSFMTYSNKAGVYLAQDLTREQDGLLLTVVANQATVDKACAICQSATEDEIGQRPEVDGDGHATPAARSAIERRVNGKIDDIMLVNIGEGVPVSSCKWTMDPNSDLSGATPTLLGTLEITLNGLVHSVSTVAKVS